MSPLTTARRPPSSQPADGRLARRLPSPALGSAARRPPLTGRPAGRSPSSPPATSTTSTPGRRTTRSRYEITYATQRPLLAYKPNSINADPGPRVRDADVRRTGGKTVTVHIRPGVRFSPPVNRDVDLGRREVRDRARHSRRASRTATPARTSATSSARPSKAAKARAEHHAGSRRRTSTTLVFQLKRPDGVFTGSLASADDGARAARVRASSSTTRRRRRTACTRSRPGRT